MGGEPVGLRIPHHDGLIGGAAGDPARLQQPVGFRLAVEPAIGADDRIKRIGNTHVIEVEHGGGGGVIGRNGEGIALPAQAFQLIPDIALGHGVALDRGFMNALDFSTIERLVLKKGFQPRGHFLPDFPHCHKGTGGKNAVFQDLAVIGAGDHLHPDGGEQIIAFHTPLGPHGEVFGQADNQRHPGLVEVKQHTILVKDDEPCVREHHGGFPVGGFPVMRVR